MAQNTVTIIGNLTRDPELRFTSGGQAVCSMGVAINSKWNDRSGQPQERTDYFDVTAWGTLGENVAASLTKGDRVIIDGKLSYRTWQTQDGDNRSKVEINADNIGPDLRFAQAQVTRNERQNNGGGYQTSNGGYNGGSQRPAQPQQGRQAPAQRPARPAAQQPAQQPWGANQGASWGAEESGWDAVQTVAHEAQQNGYLPGEEEEPF